MDNIIAECLVEKGAVDRLKDLFDNLSNQNFTKVTKFSNYNIFLNKK
jgi:hypothetical protein